MSTITINGANVHVLGDTWSKHTLISLAVNSEEFSIEHETDAQYGQLEIFTLNDGLRASIREISEDQIEEEELGDRFGFAFVQTTDPEFGNYDKGHQFAVRYWKVEAHEEEASEAA